MTAGDDLTDLPAHRLIGPRAERMRRNLTRSIPDMFDQYRARYIDTWEPAAVPPNRTDPQ